MFLIGSAWRLLAGIEYLSGVAFNKKPAATGSRRASFSRTGGWRRWLHLAPPGRGEV